MIKVEIGLDDAARKAVADAVAAVLADTHALYMKTHGYHWNVTGPQFQTLHVMFETHYREMWAALDALAERIRALGHFAPSGGEAIGARTDIRAPRETPPAAADMVRQLLADHETLIRRARRAVVTASDAGDAATEDLLTQRIQIHEQTAWMLRAMAA